MVNPNSTKQQVVLAGPAGAWDAEAGARQEALERMEELRAAMLRALEVLHAVRALFELKPGVTRAEFGRFVGGAIERLPELQALEWIPRVRGADRVRLEEAARAEGLGDYGLRAIDGRGRLVEAGEAEEYWPVHYVEPAAANSSCVRQVLQKWLGGLVIGGTKDFCGMGRGGRGRGPFPALD